MLCRPPGGIIVIYYTKYQSGWQPGIDLAATPKEGSKGTNQDLHHREGSQEGGSEGLQACHFTLAQRPLCLFPGWRRPSAGCARLVAGALTGGAPTSSRRGVMSRAAEDGRVLLEAAQQLHAERHGPKTFLPGTRLSFLDAAKRAGIRSDRQRYYDAIEDLEYEGAIEWDKSARYARGDKHYLITQRGLNDLDSAGTVALQVRQQRLFEG